jgi:hydroxyatrazine ethylaminohydrolase
MAGTLHDPKNLLGHVGCTGYTALTMAAGKVIWDGKKLTGLQEAGLDERELSRNNICVSLGVDGSATNDGSSLLDAMRVAYLMQCQKSKERHGNPSPYDVLKIATVNGAKTLGCPELGSLAVGQGADLFMIDTRPLEMAGTLHDPKNLLGHVGCTGYTALTMAAGKVIWDGKKLTGLAEAGLDERELSAKAEEVCTRVLRSKFKEYFN